MPTQAERRAATQLALLDAAATVLVDLGLAGFTTSTVTDRAGVSNGALFRHFPTRLDLIAATVEHVLVRLRTEYDATFGGLGDRPDIETVLDLLWAAMSDPQFAAVMEVYTQARTDAALLAAIHPIVVEHGEYVHELTGRVSATIAAPGDDHDRDRITTLGNLAILTMQGLVVGQMAGASTGYERDLLTAFADLIASPPTHSPSTRKGHR